MLVPTAAAGARKAEAEANKLANKWKQSELILRPTNE